MANPAYRPPRTLFGFSAQPLPGSENPMLSSSMQERFNRAGLQSFTPYLDPWSTVAQAQGYREFERDLNRREQMASAEDRFLQAVQEDPQTGYEKFIAQNPLATMSPMVRAYAVTRDRMRNEPKQDRLALETAQMGAPYLATYEKGKAANPIGAYAEAVSQYNRDQAEAKKKAVADDRLNLTGDRREEYDSIRRELTDAQSNLNAEPTDDEKRAFLPKRVFGNSDEEWAVADKKVRESRQQRLRQAQDGLTEFVEAYGSSYKIPGVNMGVPKATTPSVPISAGTPQASSGVPDKVLGFDVRPPFQGEDTYFKANPNVAGMAAEDGKITLNPYSKLSPEEMSAVAENEAFRLKMREMNYTPKFSITPEQQKTLAGSEYEKNPAAAKQTILARILSGDPSVGAITGEQKREAEAFRSRATGSPTTPAPVPAPMKTPPPQAQAAPTLPRDEESEKLWGEYLDLENSMRVDANSTTPSDQEADREIRGEMNQIRSKIMSKLKIPDTKDGRKLFENVWLGRKNSLEKTPDSQGEFLREPLRKTGVTGNSWVIRPA